MEWLELRDDYIAYPFGACGTVTPLVNMLRISVDRNSSDNVIVRNPCGDTLTAEKEGVLICDFTSSANSLGLPTDSVEPIDL